MFNIFFGWRKASKCKKLIKQVQCRLKLLKNKRYSIVRQLREDVAQLIKIGREDVAHTRAEHLLKDESIVEVYNLLDDFCEFVIIHLSYIRKHKECPNDINEAISSLIYASARCGDLPELRLIRKLFGERYGKRFEMTALELLPGNLVNHQVKEKLSAASVSDDLKRKMVDEIARDCCLRPQILALEYSPAQDQQVKEHFGEEVLDTRVQISASQTGGFRMQNGQPIYVDLSPVQMSPTRPSYLLQNSELISNSLGSSAIQQCSPDIIPDSKTEVFAYQYEKKLIASGNEDKRKNDMGSSTNQECKLQRETAASSSECLPQFPDEMIVYLDDIEELRSPTTNEESCQDQRVFKFKSSLLSKYSKIGERSDVKYLSEYESGNESSNSSSCKKKDQPIRKRSRRRPVSRESANIKDIDCAIYYGTPCKRSSTHKYRLHSQSNHHRNECEQPCFAKLGQRKSHIWHEADDCYLNNPCYFCTRGDRDNDEVQVWKHKRGISTSQSPEQNQAPKNIHQCHWSPIRVTGAEMEEYAIPRPRRRCCEVDTVLYDVFSCQDRVSFMEKNNAEKVGGQVSLGNHAASNVSYPTSSPRIRKVNKPPYSRAMTMPQERSNKTENILRSSSFPNQSPNHVHPKLPDYDDIAAKFMALKKENLQTGGFRA